MTESELDDVTGGAFSSFDVQQIGATTFSTASMDLDVRGATNADIGSLKLGYWDRNDGNLLGWDQDWTSISLYGRGQPVGTGDFKFEGLFIEAVFDDINNPATRELMNVRIGFRDVDGDINAVFNSVSGWWDPDGSGALPADPVLANRTRNPAGLQTVSIGGGGAEISSFTCSGTG